MTYNLIIILLEFKFLSKCKLFTTMKELVVKGLYSATCNFDFPRSEFPVIINIPMTVYYCNWFYDLKRRPKGQHSDISGVVFVFRKLSCFSVYRQFVRRNVFIGPQGKLWKSQSHVPELLASVMGIKENDHLITNLHR